MTRPGGTWRNWSRTVKVRPQRVERPATADAVRRSIAAAAARGMRVKAVGSGHSFSAVAAAPGVLLDLGELSGLVEVDRDRGRARFLAGTPLRRVATLLAPHGLAMPNLGDIDRQTVAGAISTGTHGTGSRFGGLASQVVAARLVTAAGEFLEIDESRDPGLLPAVSVGLGALGVLVDVTLQCVPAFVLHALERPEPLDAVLETWDERTSGADHFEFFWFPHTDRAMTKTNTRLPGDAPRHPLSPLGRWVDDALVGNGLHQLAVSAGSVVPAIVPAVNGTAVRVWGNREFTDVSHRVFTTSRVVRFREMEYAVPAGSLVPAFAAMRTLVEDRGWRISFPVEVRCAAADDAWLSTAYERDCAYIAVHRYWREDPTDFFDAVEELMLRHDGRPHWGKHHSLDAAALRTRYPRFDDFVALRDRLDPDRMFQNAYLRRVLGD